MHDVVNGARGPAPLPAGPGQEGAMRHPPSAIDGLPIAAHPGSRRAPAGRAGAWPFKANVPTTSALPAEAYSAYSRQGDGCPDLKSFLGGYFHQGWCEEFRGMDARAVLDRAIASESGPTLANVLKDIDRLLHKEEISAGVLRDLRIDACYPGNEHYRDWFSMMRRKVAAGIAEKSARTYLVARRRNEGAARAQER